MSIQGDIHNDYLGEIESREPGRGRPICGTSLRVEREWGQAECQRCVRCRKPRPQVAQADPEQVQV